MEPSPAESSLTPKAANACAAAERSHEVRSDGLAGVLATPPPGTWALHRREPSSNLHSLVAWLWAVEWDLSNHNDHVQSTLPHPSAHLVIENGSAMVHGPTTRRFTRTLSGIGRVIAIRFHPAGLQPFLNSPVSELVDAVVPAEAVLRLDGQPNVRNLIKRIGSQEDLDVAMGLLESLLDEPKLPIDPSVDEVNRIVESIASDRSITNLASLRRVIEIHPRRVQRLFARYVGMTPKAVIRRYRLQEAASAALSGQITDWAAVAADLGYYDQAHLVRDFTDAIGTPPAEYAKRSQ
ncbi:MAG: AraC family transcriptional regulator [Acidimicrobiales bacterium]